MNIPSSLVGNRPSIMALAESFACCESIAKGSGSNFYRSFSLLGRDRRNAMLALYAFARLADDATDDLVEEALPQHPITGGTSQSKRSWDAKFWHDWVESLSNDNPGQLNDDRMRNDSESLMRLRPALVDTVRKYAIPLECLHDIVRGVNMDMVDGTTFDNWDQTRLYCHRVASSVGLACLAIWSKNPGCETTASVHRAAMDCGVAFQMTNILRDLAEDSQRGRIYLPADELARFGIDQDRWLQLRAGTSGRELDTVGDWRGLLRIQFERAKALFENGWHVTTGIGLDGQRMFSLMWHTYRRLLEQLESNPGRIWQTRARVSTGEKLLLASKHFFTPAFSKLFRQQTQSIANSKLHGTDDLPTDAMSLPSRWPTDGPRVAVAGAGLAGINAAMHLARHGCKVSLFEAKNRLGGRVGSFTDSESGQSVDYCQHVGMVCCTALQQWIADTQQQSCWTEQSTLHFVDASGAKLDVSAWPFPAPFHLAGLILRWPQLGMVDRARVAWGLSKLQRLKMTPEMGSQLAIAWLKENHQSERCITNFWATILVSALGEQVDRVTLGATHKVLVDGFAAHRRAFHLLVPNRPLSELLSTHVLNTLVHLGVDVQLGKTIGSVENGEHRKIRLTTSSQANSNAAQGDMDFDVLVVAVPWYKLNSLLPERLATKTDGASRLDSSPITGVHTWWDKPWLKTPHAILIGRLCQWVFPAPSSDMNDEGVGPNAAESGDTKEHYYQIVISASRSLPRGDSNAILEQVRSELSDVFPDSRSAKWLRGKVVTDPNSVFSVNPGHESGRLRSDLLRSEGVWVAGDWTDTGWPATMEGALRSGATAASSVLEHFGRDAKLSD